MRLIFLLVIFAQTAWAQGDLFLAVRKNNVKAAEKSLALGVNVNAADDKGLVPLHYAAAYNYPEMVKWLLAHGADVNKTNKWLWTPLHYALGCDHVTDKLCPKPDPERTLAVVKLLVEAKANVNAADDHGVSPVFLASDDLKILKYLQEHGGCVDSGYAYRGQTPLHFAISSEASAENIKFILQNGGRDKINSFDGDGYAPLHRAVQFGNLNAVKLLVEYGANINLARDIDECETPLEMAEEAKQTEIVKYLKAHGAIHKKSTIKNQAGTASP